MNPLPSPMLVKRSAGLRRAVNRMILGFLLVVIGTFTTWRVFLWCQNHSRLKEIAKRGEPVNADDLDAMYLAVPDNENAALLWLKGVNQTVPPHRANSQTPWQRFKVPSRGASTSEETMAEYRGSIVSNAATLAIFREASRLERARFPADFSRGVMADFPHLAQIKTAARLLQMEAFVSCKEGRIDQSVDSIATMLAAGRSLRAEPTVLAQLVAYAIDALACEALQHLLNHQQINANDLEFLNAGFFKSEDTHGLARAFLGERALLVSTFRPPKGLPEPKEEAEENPVKMFRNPFVRASGIIERELGFCLDALTTNIALAKLPDPHRSTSQTNWDGILERAEKNWYFTSSLLLPSMAKIAERDVADRARLRIALTAIAIERFAAEHRGELPANLESLTPRYLKAILMDPFDGNPLRFAKRDKGYVVYSIGKDGKDDGGTEWRRGLPRHAPEDITFMVERK